MWSFYQTFNTQIKIQLFILRYSCDSGHELIGASVVTCLEDQDGDEFGTWSRLPPVCLGNTNRVRIRMVVVQQ